MNAAVPQRRNIAGARYLRAVGLALLAFGLPAAGAGQARVTGADLEGVVWDEFDGILPGARVAVVNAETGVTRAIEAGMDGRFRVLALPPGSYSITVERPGFAPVRRDGIVLVLGQSARLDFRMKIASVEEGITVVAETPVVDAAHTALSSVVSQEQVQNLPINGRNFLSFTLMTPGVTTDRTPQQGATATSGLSFTGQRARSNNIMVDGFDNNDATVGAVRATFSQDAVREFQVLANAYSAEFGKAAGGVVNIVSRSGTNELRGTVFGYSRDEALNAKDHFERFDPFGNRLDREKAPLGQIQWGGVVGGPVRKAKTFFLGSFERLAVNASNFVNIDPQAATVLRENGFPVELGHVPYKVGTTDVLGKLDHQFSPTSTLVVRANVGTSVNEVGRQRFTPQARKNDRYQLTETVSFAAGVKAPRVVEYQVRQTDNGVDVVVVADGPIEIAGLAAAIEDNLRQAGLASPTATVREVGSMSRHPQTGKTRRFIPVKCDDAERWRQRRLG